LGWIAFSKRACPQIGEHEMHVLDRKFIRELPCLFNDLELGEISLSDPT